jgi:hypothetical protein
MYRQHVQKIYPVRNDQLISVIYSNDDMRHFTNSEADRLKTLSIIAAYQLTHCTKHQYDDKLHY